MSHRIRVTVWGENIHEQHSEVVRGIYPEGMHEAFAEDLRKRTDAEVRTATLQQPEHGLTQEVLDATDVLTWWAGRTFAVMQNRRRYLPGMRAARELVVGGSIGTPGFVSVDVFLGPHFGGFREAMAHPLLVDMAMVHAALESARSGLRFEIRQPPQGLAGREGSDS